MPQISMTDIGETGALTRRRLLHRGALLLPLPAILAAVSPALAAPPETKPAKKPDPALVPIEDDPKLPRVMLIGDSISMGYTPIVRKTLQGVANVHHPAENCAETAHGLKRLSVWLGDKKWDVIHFNFGLHDLKYLDEKGAYVPPDKGKQVALIPDYEAHLRELVVSLKKTGAHLIWASTTPVPARSLGRVEGDEKGYNAAAARIMGEAGIPIDDLYAIAAAHQAEIQLPHNVHFTKAGYEQLADSVVRSVRAALDAGPMAGAAKA